MCRSERAVIFFAACARYPHRARVRVVCVNFHPSGGTLRVHAPCARYPHHARVRVVCVNFPLRVAPCGCTLRVRALRTVHVSRRLQFIFSKRTLRSAPRLVSTLRVQNINPSGILTKIFLQKSKFSENLGQKPSGAGFTHATHVRAQYDVCKHVHMIVHIHSYATCAYVSQPKGFNLKFLLLKGGPCFFFENFQKQA